MHAFIDEGNYRDMTIDKALRLLLKDFKQPGGRCLSLQHKQSVRAGDLTFDPVAKCFSSDPISLFCTG